MRFKFIKVRIDDASGGALGIKIARYVYCRLPPSQLVHSVEVRVLPLAHLLFAPEAGGILLFDTISEAGGILLVDPRGGNRFAYNVRTLQSWFR